MKPTMTKDNTAPVDVKLGSSTEETKELTAQEISLILEAAAKHRVKSLRVRGLSVRFGTENPDEAVDQPPAPAAATLSEAETSEHLQKVERTRIVEEEADDLDLLHILDPVAYEQKLLAGVLKEGEMDGSDEDS